MKKLHWNKLPNHMVRSREHPSRAPQHLFLLLTLESSAVQAEATVWQELAANLQQLRLDFAGLEADFAAKAIHHGKHPKAEAGGRGQSKIMLLPMKRSQNIGVFISRLKLTPAKVRPHATKSHQATFSCAAGSLRITHLCRLCRPRKGVSGFSLAICCFIPSRTRTR